MKVLPGEIDLRGGGSFSFSWIFTESTEFLDFHDPRRTGKSNPEYAGFNPEQKGVTRIASDLAVATQSSRSKRSSGEQHGVSRVDRSNPGAAGSI